MCAITSQRTETTNIIPVIRTIVSLPDKSVTCCKQNINWISKGQPIPYKLYKVFPQLQTKDISKN